MFSTFQPLVSIIIPSYNRELLIEETLNSILAQTYPYWECIIVDDGSTDKTNEIITKYCTEDARFKLIIRARAPKGAPTARNIGFENSNGSYIQFFDSDDIMHKDLLKNKMEIAKNHPELDLILCRFKFFPENRAFISNLTDDLLLKPLDNYLLKQLHLDTLNVLIKRSLLLTAGLFNEKLLKAQEVELFTRLLINTNQINFYGEGELVYKRLHSKSITGEYLDYESKRIFGNIKTRLLILKTLNRKKPQIDKKVSCYIKNIILSDIRSLSYSKNNKYHFRSVVITLISGLFKSDIMQLLKAIGLSVYKKIMPTNTNSKTRFLLQ